MTESKGGGTHQIECKKNTSLQEVAEKVPSVFFPNGMSAIGIKADEVEYHIAKYSGEKVQEEIDGEPYTFGKYRQVHLKSVACLYNVSFFCVILIII